MSLHTILLCRRIQMLKEITEIVFQLPHCPLNGLAFSSERLCIRNADERVGMLFVIEHDPLQPPRSDFDLSRRLPNEREVMRAPAVKQAFTLFKVAAPQMGLNSLVQFGHLLDRPERIGDLFPTQFIVGFNRWRRPSCLMQVTKRISEVLSSWFVHAMESKPIRANLKLHKLIMSFGCPLLRLVKTRFAGSISKLHLQHGSAGCNDCCETGNQSLEIVDKVPQIASTGPVVKRRRVFRSKCNDQDHPEGRGDRHQERAQVCTHRKLPSSFAGEASSGCIVASRAVRSVCTLGVRQ